MKKKTFPTLTGIALKAGQEVCVLESSEIIELMWVTIHHSTNERRVTHLHVYKTITPGRVTLP